jgi:hypothetical protein
VGHIAVHALGGETQEGLEGCLSALLSATLAFHGQFDVYGIGLAAAGGPQSSPQVRQLKFESYHVLVLALQLEVVLDEEFLLRE